MRCLLATEAEQQEPHVSRFQTLRSFLLTYMTIFFDKKKFSPKDLEDELASTEACGRVYLTVYTIP